MPRRPLYSSERFMHEHRPLTPPQRPRQPAPLPLQRTSERKGSKISPCSVSCPPYRLLVLRQTLENEDDSTRDASSNPLQAGIATHLTRS